MSMITILRTQNDENLAKRYSIGENGTPTVSSYQNAYRFRWQEQGIENIRQFYRLLSQLRERSHACIIRGAPVENLPQLVTRTIANFPEPEEGVPWVMLDIDGVEPPDGVNPCSHEAVEFVVSRLPAEFQEVSYVAMLSNSAGIRTLEGELLKPGVRVHLFYWLDRPVQGRLLAAWLERLCYDSGFYTVGPNKGNVAMATPGIDMAPLRSSVQIHYTADPLLGEGVVCDVPPEARVWLHEKSGNDVAIPELEPNLLGEAVDRRNEIRRNWAIENGYRLERRLVTAAGGRYRTERLVPDNPAEVRLGRDLLDTELRGDGNILGLKFADEKTPNSWYVVKSRPWLARRMGDETEIPLEEFCPAAVEEVIRLGWVRNITGEPDGTDGRAVCSADRFLSVQSEPPSGMVTTDRDSYLSNLFRMRWGAQNFIYAGAHIQTAIGDPPKTQWVILFSFFYVYAKVRTENNAGWAYVLHVLCADNSWNEVILAAQDLHDGNKAAMQLAFRGVEIFPMGRKLLSKYIQEYPCQRMQRLVERTGWSNDGSRFVLPEHIFSSDPEGSQEDIYVTESAKNLIRGVRSKGTLGDWQASIPLLCLGNSRLEMALYLAFLPPLMKPLGHPTFGTHFWGTTSTGKSTAKQIAVSVWGDPAEAAHQWRATDNGLEGLAHAHNDVLMALDEIKQTTGHQVVADAVFLLGNEKGKVRADRDGGLRPIRQWRLAYVSTGEISTVQFLRDGGIAVMGGHAVRILDISADGGAGMGVIETLVGYPTPETQVEALDVLTQQYHGTAAVAFLEALFASGCLDNLRDRLQALSQEFLALLPERNRNPEMRRILKHFIAIAFAGELAIEFGVLPYSPGQALHTMVRMALEHENARGGSEGFDILERIAWIRREISRNRYSNFKRLDRRSNAFRDGGGGNPRVFWGYAIYSHAESDQILDFRIPRALFKAVFCQNLNADRLIEALRERGFLSEDGHLVGQHRERCYVLSYAFVSGGDEEVEGGEEEDEPGRTFLDEMSDI